jgi:uncharacterized protein
MSASRLHWRIGSYITLVIAAAWLWFWSFRLGFRPPEWFAVLVLMWIPWLLSILFRVMFKEGFADVGWAVGEARFWAWAYVTPLCLAVLSVLVAVCLGRVALAPHLSQQTMLDAVVVKLPWLVQASSSVGFLCQRLLAVAFLGMVPGFFFALGEELGWRGYLLPQLLRAGWRFPLLFSGLVWGIWHFPLFVFTGYGHGAIGASLVMFTLLTILFGVFVGWLRLASGSVFVAAMAHASFNGFVQSLIGDSFVGESAWFWVGDYGLLTLISYACLVGWLYQSRRVCAALKSSNVIS